MRVASSLMMSRYKDQINAAYMNQAKMMEQSDGSKLHRPSDNSVAYSRYLNYQNRDTENLQYQDNVKAGISWMKTSDAAMVNMTDIYTTLKEKTVDAANDTNNDNDLITAIAKEVKAKLYEMVSLGNNQQGDRYLFAGQSDLTQPFQISTEEKDRGLTKNLDDPQSKFFKNPNDTKNLNADDTGSLTQFLQVDDADGNTYFVNTQNGRIYTEDFVQNGYKDKLKEGVEHVEEGDEYAILPFFDTDALNVAGYFEATGVIRTEGNVTVTASDGSGDTETTYNYGDQIQMGWNDTAVADVPVYVLDGDGNMRVVAKGNTVKLDASKWEKAYVGVPLNATTYKTGTLMALGSISKDPEVGAALSFNAGDRYTLETYEYAIIDSDVKYYVGNSTEPKYAKAGDVIPATYGDYDDVKGTDAITIEFLTDKSSILRDPKRVNNDEVEPKDITYLKGLIGSLDDDLKDASIKMDKSLTVERKTEETDVTASNLTSRISLSSPRTGRNNANITTIAKASSGVVIANETVTVKLSNGNGGYTLRTVLPGNDLAELAQSENFEGLKIGSFASVSAFDSDTTTSTATVYEKINTGEGVELDNQSIFADKPVTIQYMKSDGTLGYNVIAAGNDLKAAMQDDAVCDIKIGSYSTDLEFAAGDPDLTTNLEVYTYEEIPNTEELNGYLREYRDDAGGVVNLKIGAYNNKADFDAADSETANITIYYHNTLASKEMKTGDAILTKDADGKTVNTFISKYLDEDGNPIPVYSVTLPYTDVMIENDNGNARMIKAGNPLTTTLDSGEDEAILIGKVESRHHFDGFTTIKQPIVTYQGDARYISMVKLNGTVDQMADTINATGQDLNGSDIFDDKNSGNMTTLMSNGRICYISSGTAMINNMFTVAAKLEHGDRKWMRTDGITIADKAHEVITMTQGTTAARQNVYDNVSQMLTKQSETITEDINNVSATDVAELAVRLMAAQTIYSMSLSVGSRILPPSLADYL